MRLVSLHVVHGASVVREITFKSGLNLILDRPTSGSTESGNNVGKTTVLRLIDFCLGSDGDDIWQDSEFKKNVNQEVFSYLHDPAGVSVSLVVQKTSLFQHRITRSFQTGKGDPAAYSIDATTFKNITAYRDALKELLFGSTGAKPTLRQLVPKFVRSSQRLMSKTLKFLGDYGSETDYEALHLFLFGFFAVDVLEQRPRLTSQRKQLVRDLEALRRSRTEGEIEQLLLHLRREVAEANQAALAAGEVPEIAARAAAVTAIRAEATDVAATIGRFEGELASLDLTARELNSDYANIDRHAIEAIYREAERYVPKLHHDWAELIDFVQSLRERKQRFLEAQAQSIRETLSTRRSELANLQRQELTELGSVAESPAFKQALSIRADLEEKLKRLGSLEQDLEDIRDLKASIADKESQLLETKKQIEEGKELLGSRVAIFNRYFSELSKALYGEQYLLHFDDTAKGSLSFQLSAVGSNVGAGKKLSQTAAFDLAYIKFLADSGISFPRFVCHDGVESIHANQLIALLTAADQLDGQLVLATLRDKLPAMPEGFLERNTILELSQNDKLFRL